MQASCQLTSTPQVPRSECHMHCHPAHSSLLCCCLQHCLSKAEGSSNMHNLDQLLTCLHMADTAEHSLQITTRVVSLQQHVQLSKRCLTGCRKFAARLHTLADAVAVKSAHRTGHGVLYSPEIDSNKAVHQQKRTTDTRKKMSYTLHPRRNPWDPCSLLLREGRRALPDWHQQTRSC